MSEFPLVTNKDNNLDNTNAKRSTQNILNEKDYNSINLQTFIELLETPIKKRKPEELEILYNYLRSTDLLDILKKEKIPLLDINSLLKTFSQNLKIKTINKNNVLFRYDDNGDKFFIILNGKVSILIPKLKKISITGGAYFDYLVSLFISEEEYLLKNSIANNYPEIGFINFEDFVKYLEIYFKNLIIELANGNEDHFNWQNVLNLINKYRKDVTFLGIENEGDFRKVFKLDKKLNDLKIIGRNSLDKRGSLKSFKNDSDKNIISNFILANNSNNIENYDFKILNDIETILYELYFENDNYNTGSFKADSEFAYNYFYGENGKYESMKFSEELGEENLYEQFRFIFKYGSFRNYINNLLKLTNEENFFYLKHKHVREYGSPMETSNNQYKVYYYEKIRELSTGSFFGDFALESDNKKRTATIRAEQDCILGYIDQAIYDQYIFQENKKIKLKNIQFIHSISLFKGINQRTIERHYYGEFEIIELYKDQFIFKQADINEEINKNNMLFNRGKENFSKHEENNSKNGNDNLTNKDSHNEKHNKNTTNENNKNKEKNEKSNLENNSTQNNSNNHNSIITMNTNSNNITLFLLKSGTIDIYFFGNLKELQELLKILIDKLYIMEIIPRELYETILHKYLVFIDPNKKSKDFMNNFLTKRQYLLYTVNSSQLIGIELLFFDLPNIYLAKVKSDKLKGFSIEGKKLQAIIQANPQIKGIYEKLAKTKINSLISRLNTIKNSFLNIFEAKSKDYMMYKHLQDNLAKEIEKNLLSKCNENEYENENIEDINKEIIKDNSIEENNNSLRNSPKEEKKILKEFEEQKFNMSQIYNPANIKNIPFFDLHNFKKNAVKEFSEYINHFKVPNIKSINQINNPNGNYNNTSYENSVEKYVEDNKNGNLTDEDDKEDNKIDKKNNRNIVISYFKIAQNYNSDQKKIHQISLSPKMTKTAQSNFSSIKQNKSNKKCLIKNLEEVNNFPEDLNKQLEFQEGTDFESLLNRDDRPHNTNNFFFNNLKFKNENKQSFKKISKLQHKNLSVNAQNLININNDYNIFHEKNFIEFKTNFFEENKDSLFKNQQDSDQKSENLIRIDKKETRKISPDYSSDKFNFFNISSVKYIESRKDQNLKKLGGKIKNDIFRLSSVDFNRKESYNSVLYEVNNLAKTNDMEPKTKEICLETDSISYEEAIKTKTTHTPSVFSHKKKQIVNNLLHPKKNLLCKPLINNLLYNPEDKLDRFFLDYNNQLYSNQSHMKLIKSRNINSNDFNNQKKDSKNYISDNDDKEKENLRFQGDNASKILIRGFSNNQKNSNKIKSLVKKEKTNSSIINTSNFISEKNVLSEVYSRKNSYLSVNKSAINNIINKNVVKSPKINLSYNRNICKNSFAMVNNSNRLQNQILQETLSRIVPFPLINVSEFKELNLDEDIFSPSKKEISKHVKSFRESLKKPISHNKKIK